MVDSSFALLIYLLLLNVKKRCEGKQKFLSLGNMPLFMYIHCLCNMLHSLEIKTREYHQTVMYEK